MEIYSLYLRQLVDFIPFNQFIKYIHCKACKKILIDKIIEYNEEVCDCDEFSCFICSALIKRFLTKYLYKIKCNQCRYSNNHLIYYQYPIILFSQERCLLQITNTIDYIQETDIILQVKPLVNKLYQRFNWKLQRILWIALAKDHTGIGKLDKEILTRIITIIETDSNDLIHYIHKYILTNNHLLDNTTRIMDKHLTQLTIPFNYYQFSNLSSLINN